MKFNSETFSILATLSSFAAASHPAQYGQSSQVPFSSQKQIGNSTEYWTIKYGPQYDLAYSGPLTFEHLPYTRCLEDTDTKFDIAILGIPFDTAVSYRPGARFGPSGIRQGSSRQNEGGWTLTWGSSPFNLTSALMDCGDVPATSFDNAKAIDQMEVAYSTLLMRPVAGGIPGHKSKNYTAHLAKDGKEHPRIVTLGGDHTIVLPILRSLNKVYGPVSVIHFDAHIDTWITLSPNATAQERITHGSFFTVAYQEGLIRNNSVHAGIRCQMEGIEDMTHDGEVGFQAISADDLDDYGIKKIIEGIRRRIGSSPVYLSLDIDVVDPGLAPATGTTESGGWTTREVKRILRGLTGLNFVGADIVEVSPAYDTADITIIAAADIVHDYLTMFQTDVPPKPHKSSLFKHLAH